MQDWVQFDRWHVKPVRWKGLNFGPLGVNIDISW